MTLGQRRTRRGAVPSGRGLERGECFRQRLIQIEHRSAQCVGQVDRGQGLVVKAGKKRREKFGGGLAMDGIEVDCRSCGLGIGERRQQRRNVGKSRALRRDDTMIAAQQLITAVRMRAAEHGRQKTIPLDRGLQRGKFMWG